jgi:hypothetical protein
MKIDRQVASKARVPWISCIALLYPIAAAIFISRQPAATASDIAGYGLSNLAYAMFVGAIFTGTFGIFGLQKRWKVFAVAIAVLLAGVVASNVR